MGSIILHLTTTRLGQILDFSGMFICVGYLLYESLKIVIKNPIYLNILLILISVLEIFILLYFIEYRILLFTIILVILLINESIFITKNKYVNFSNWLRS